LNIEREREKTEEEVVAQFERWAKNPQVRDLICQAWISPEERERRLRQICGLPPEETSSTASESNSVKPSQTESNPIKPYQTQHPETGN
jgi:hypothetical protein